MPPNPISTDALADTILAIARVPSFTSYEQRQSPFIRQFCAALPDIHIVAVPDNRLIFSTAAATRPCHVLR